MPLSLRQLLAAAGLPGPDRGGDRAVSAVVHDSRESRPGAVFVALPGAHVDGLDYAVAAVERGAVAVVSASLPCLPASTGAAAIVVDDPQVALARLAARLAGDPSRHLTVAGITGTDGKTTTVAMLHAAWRGAGIAAASLSTVDFRTVDRIEPNPTRTTTLFPPELHRRLRQALDAGCSHVALETSSHALASHRVDEVEYRVAVVLRITSEHLDFHKSRGAYVAAKASLVERAAAHPDGVAVLDGDDRDNLPRLAAIGVSRRLVVSAAGDPAADLCAEGVVAGPDGVGFLARTPWGEAGIRLRLAGRFNVGNALAAIAAACATGASLGGAAAGVEGLERVGGRMERVVVADEQDVTAVVDYAHTAAALERVLGELRAGRGRLVVVFGSAGERDRAKRPAMGAVAARLADLLVLTDEDPRGEDALAILDEIAAGAEAAGARRGDRLLVIPDRAEAIETAVGSAAPGDTLVFAGKGHETSIIGPRGPLPWDERAAVEAALRRRLGTRPPRPRLEP